MVDLLSADWSSLGSNQSTPNEKDPGLIIKKVERNVTFQREFNNNYFAKCAHSSNSSYRKKPKRNNYAHG